MSSIPFDHPSVHPQEDLYMLFYDISFMHPYKQSGQWQDVFVRDTSLPEDEHFHVRSTSKKL